jgi:hypothetical protein
MAINLSPVTTTLHGDNFIVGIVDNGDETDATISTCLHLKANIK